jgi:ubiquinone/menaquinone biosynthesis C-methylase UbiE
MHSSSCGEGSDGLDWRRVDESRDPKRVIRALDSVQQGMSHFRSLSMQMLEVGPGHCVADVGCGTGETTRTLAEAVGPAGAAIGIDASTAMIAEARERADSANSSARFVIGSAQRLPLPDACLDGCRIERTLQHLDEPHDAVAAMLRALQPGGRIVAMEPDWGGLVLDHPDRPLTRKILAIVSEGIRQPWIGRRLYATFKRAGLGDVHAEVVSAQAGYVWFPANRALRAAVSNGALDAAALDTWLRDCAEADAAGTFYCSQPVFLVSGRKHV